MSILAGISSPSVPKTPNIKPIALLYAGILVAFVVTQLFSFTNFQILVQSYWLPGGKSGASLLAGIIVVSEVLALPFLLRMKMSTLMRVVSMALGWLVPLVWLGINIWSLTTVNAVHNIGFLGTVISLEPGWWTLLFSLALGVLAVWASWGMWPRFKPSAK